VAGEDQTIRIVDVDAGKELITLHGHPPSNNPSRDVVCAAAWSPDGKRLAAASPDGTFLLWDAATWTELLTLPKAPTGLTGMVNNLTRFGGTLAWSPDGWQLGFFQGGTVTIWDGTPQAVEPGR
jgi:WD40 repeat protein